MVNTIKEKNKLKLYTLLGVIALPLFFFFFSFNFSYASTQVSSTIHVWHFDEATGTSAADELGLTVNQIDGTTGSATTTWRFNTGKFGNAIQMRCHTGTDTGGFCGDPANPYSNNTSVWISTTSTDLTGNLNFTITAWIQEYTDAGQDHGIFESSHFANDEFNSFKEATQGSGAGNDLVWHIKGQAWDIGTSTKITNETSTTWYMVTLTHTAAGKVTLCYNGTTYCLGATESGTLNLIDSRFAIGNTNGAGIAFNQGFVGAIDDVALYNAILSSSTLTTIYNGGTGNCVYKTTDCDSAPPPSTTPTIDFAYPTSSIFTYSNFNAWVASTTNESYTSTDFIEFVYSKYLKNLTDAKVNMGSHWDGIIDPLVAYTTKQINGIIPSHRATIGSSSLFAINSIDNLQNATWSAYAFIYSSTGTILAYSPYLTFSVGTSTASYPTNSTTTNLAGPFGQLPYQTNWSPIQGINTEPLTDCQRNATTSIWTNLTSEGITNVIYCAWTDFTTNILDETQSKSVLVLNNAIATMKTVFPINLITAVNNDISTASNSTSTSADIIFNATSSPNVFGGNKLVWLTSSTTAWVKDSVGFDYKDWISKFLYLITGIFILLRASRLYNRIMSEAQQFQMVQE